MPASAQLILASSSPYRRELLSRLGVDFHTESPEVDETPEAGESGAALAQRLAELKARTVAARHPQAIVIGSDQVAECKGRLLGKPGSEERALEQLKRMQGEEVTFHTAVCVIAGTACHTERVATRVRLRELSEAQLLRYLRREQPYDCAGAFKSEALGIALLASLSSDDPTALIGLPLIATIRLLERVGLDLLGA
ncbi:MAG: Maf family protein [Wenzhouxiangella sp.]